MLYYIIVYHICVAAQEIIPDARSRAEAPMSCSIDNLCCLCLFSSDRGLKPSLMMQHNVQGTYFFSAVSDHCALFVCWIVGGIPSGSCQRWSAAACGRQVWDWRRRWFQRGWFPKTIDCKLCPCYNSAVFHVVVLNNYCILKPPMKQPPTQVPTGGPHREPAHPQALLPAQRRDLDEN